MKKIILILLLLSNLQSIAQQLSTRDSIAVFYDSLIYQLKTNYLYSETTNWESVIPISEKALKAKSFGESLVLCTAVFDTINGSHLNIFSEHGWYKWSRGRQYKQEEFSHSFLVKYETQPGFEVKILNNKHGYILMPGMLMIDIPQDSINMEAQRMYDQIMEVVNARSLQGWIIDLRFNVGGNVFPMLAALYHFLGDNTAYLSLDQDGVVDDLVKLDRGKVFDDRRAMAAVVPQAKADTKVPVALITGILTASSGELVAVAFKGRDQVKVIGEPTAGMLTGNNLTQLPFDVKLTLTSGYLADRKAHYETPIKPDITILKQANFEDISRDPNIVEALKFLESLD